MFARRRRLILSSLDLQATLKTLAKLNDNGHPKDLKVESKEESLQRLRAASERIKGLKRKASTSILEPCVRRRGVAEFSAYRSKDFSLPLPSRHL